MNRFDELALAHLDALYRMAVYLSADPDEAEDLVQEVFLKGRRSFHTLRDEEKIKSWLCSILYRHFIDTVRRRKRHVELPPDEIAAPEADEEYEWPERLSPEEVRAGLSSLDEKYRLPLVAYFMSGQSYKEIAASLELPIGTVMSRIHRGKNLLRRYLVRVSPPRLRVVRGGRDGV